MALIYLIFKSRLPYSIVVYSALSVFKYSRAHWVIAWCRFSQSKETSFFIKFFIFLVTLYVIFLKLLFPSFSNIPALILQKIEYLAMSSLGNDNILLGCVLRLSWIFWHCCRSNGNELSNQNEIRIEKCTWYHLLPMQLSHCVEIVSLSNLLAVRTQDFHLKKKERSIFDILCVLCWLNSCIAKGEYHSKIFNTCIGARNLPFYILFTSSVTCLFGF